MDAIKNFIAGKKPGWYVSTVACLFALITVIVYGARGGNRYSAVSGAVLALLIVGIVLNVAVLYKDFGVGPFVPFIFYTISLGVMANTEMLFMSNVLFAIDNNTFDSAWLVFVVFEVLAVATSLTACIMNLSKPVKN